MITRRRTAFGLPIALVALAMLASAPAHADLQTGLYLSVGDGSQVTVPLSAAATDSTDTAWRISGGMQTADYALQFSGLVDSDPFLSYGFSIISFSSSPKAVSSEFSVDLTGGPWNAADASLSLSATGGPFGFAIVTAGPDALQTAHAGGPTQNLAVGLGGNCSGGTFQTVSCVAQQTSVGFAPEPFSTLKVDVNFVLFGFGSQATVNGRVDVTAMPPVPEPGFLDIGGFAAVLGALVWFVRRGRLMRRTAAGG